MDLLLAILSNVFYIGKKKNLGSRFLRELPGYLGNVQKCKIKDQAQMFLKTFIVYIMGYSF